MYCNDTWPWTLIQRILMSNFGFKVIKLNIRCKSKILAYFHDQYCMNIVNVTRCIFHSRRFIWIRAKDSVNIEYAAKFRIPKNRL